MRTGGEEYRDLYQAAQELGVSVKTLRKLIRWHGVPLYKLPGERRSMLRAADLAILRRPVERTPRRWDRPGRTGGPRVGE